MQLLDRHLQIFLRVLVLLDHCVFPPGCLLLSHCRLLHSCLFPLDRHFHSGWDMHKTVQQRAL